MSSATRCEYCGSELLEGAPFCGSCGKGTSSIQASTIADIGANNHETRVLKRVGILSASKVFTVVVGLIVIPVCVFIGLILITTTDPAVGIGVMIGIPIFYIIGTFLYLLLGTWIFNIALRWTGGIEIDLD